MSLTELLDSDPEPNPSPQRPAPSVVDYRPPSRTKRMLTQVGRLFTLGLEVVRLTFRRPFQVRELIEHFWFIASVSVLPAALVAIPFGAVIALQLG